MERGELKGMAFGFLSSPVLVLCFLSFSKIVIFQIKFQFFSQLY